MARRKEGFSAAAVWSKHIASDGEPILQANFSGINRSIYERSRNYLITVVAPQIYLDTKKIEFQFHTGNHSDDGDVQFCQIIGEDNIRKFTRWVHDKAPHLLQTKANQLAKVLEIQPQSFEPRRHARRFPQRGGVFQGKKYELRDVELGEWSDIKFPGEKPPLLVLKCNFPESKEGEAHYDEATEVIRGLARQLKMDGDVSLKRQIVFDNSLREIWLVGSKNCRIFINWAAKYRPGLIETFVDKSIMPQFSDAALMRNTTGDQVKRSEGYWTHRTPKAPVEETNPAAKQGDLFDDPGRSRNSRRR